MSLGTLYICIAVMAGISAFFAGTYYLICIYEKTKFPSKFAALFKYVVRNMEGSVVFIVAVTIWLLFYIQGHIAYASANEEWKSDLPEMDKTWAIAQFCCITALVTGALSVGVVLLGIYSMRASYARATATQKELHRAVEERLAQVSQKP